MKIQFSKEKLVTVEQPKLMLLKQISVISISDNYTAKKIIAYTKELGHVVLWSGNEYDNIGQWTDTDVQNRINELYNN